MTAVSVSYVIPAYNCGKTLFESVESIYNCNFEKNDEVIIVNDASTDNTQQVINKIVTNYPNVHVIINRKNKGCPASRNIGISKARKPLIFNLDSDNILAPHSISKLKTYLVDKQADCVMFEETRYFKNSIRNSTHSWLTSQGQYHLQDVLAGTITSASGGNYLYKKKSWQNVKGYWEYGSGLHEAWGFTFKLLVNNQKVFVCPDSYYYHRYGHNSLFVRESLKKNESSRIAWKMISPYSDLLDSNTLTYIKDNKNVWFDQLNTRPLKLKNFPSGTNGTIKYSFKVLLHKFIFKTVNLIKSIF